MRKSMKQRVALFLSAVMVFTSVDSSVLVAAADVTGEETVEVTQAEETVPVEEELQEEELAEDLSGESTDVVLEDAEEYGEDASVYSVEELQDEGEQLIGEEPVQTYAEDGDDNTVVSDEDTQDITVTFDREDDKWPSVEYGESVVLNAAATSSDGSALTYQWEIYQDGYWVNIEGATGSSIENSSVTHNLEYRCKVQDQKGNVYYKSFTVSAQTLHMDGDSDHKEYVELGGSITLSANKVWTDLDTGVTYAWYKEENGSANWEEPLSTEQTLKVGPVNQAVKYICYITDGNQGLYLNYNIRISTGLIIDEYQYLDEVQKGDSVRMVMVEDSAIPEGITLSYQWYYLNRKEGYRYELIPGETLNWYTAIAGDYSEEYKCIATDNYGNVYEKHFNWYINTVKVDYEQTQTRVKVPLNGETTLQMYATSSVGDITYSWEKNNSADGYDWVELKGETTSSLQVSNVTKQEEYQCILDDGNQRYGVTFTVSVDVGIEIDSYQYIEDVENGSQVVMTMIDEGSIPEGVSLDYKWYRWNRETDDYDLISSEVGNRYTVTADAYNGDYRCEAEDNFGNTYYKQFRWNMDTLEVDYEQSRWNVTVPLNGGTTLQIYATSSLGEIAYTWEKYDPDNADNDSFGWVMLDGKTSSMQVSNVTKQEKYRCTLDDGNERTSYEFTIQVDVGFEFVDNPTDVGGAIGDRIELDAEATVKEGTLSYQWYRYKNGEGYVLIPDAASPQYMATVEDAEVQYRCEVTDSYGGVHSRYIEVYPDYSITIENRYNSQSAKPGEEVTMSVTASTKAGTLAYQWQVRKTVDDEYEWENISGATDASYTVKIVDDSHYRCVVSNGHEGEEQTAWWSVYIDRGLEIGDIENQFNIEYGQDVTLTMNATTEYGKLTYKWQKYNEDIDGGSTETIEGATDSTYTVKNVQKSGTYYCIVSNGYDSFEQSYHIYVNSGLEVSVENEEVNVRKGQTATLKVNATSNYPITYKWYTQEDVDDEYVYVELGNETDTCVTSPVTGYKEYVCVVSDGYNTKYQRFYLYIDKGFRVSAEQAAVWVPKGSDAELKVNASIYEEYGDLTYQWYKFEADDEWQRIDGATSAVYTVKNVTEMQAYRCRVESEAEDSESVYFSVGPENEKENYALDFSTAKVLKENAENLAVIPAAGSGAYFKFVPNRTGVWEIYSKTDEDTKAYLYDENGKQIAYDDDGGEDTNFCLSETLEQGNTYYIQCRYYGSTQTGSFPVFVRYVGNGEEDHIWDEGTITLQPTCETTGEKTYVCMNCGETRTEEIAATGHDYPENWTVRKAATCTENGVQYRVCNNCGKEETEEIAETGHTYGDVQTTAATATENGKRYQTCTKCGMEKILEVIPATGVAEKVEAVKETVGKLESDAATGEDISNAITAIKDMDNQTMIDMDAAEDENTKSNLNDLVSKVEEKLLASEDLTDAGIKGTIGETVISDGNDAVNGATATGAAVTVASVVKEAGFDQQEGAKYQAQIQVKEKEDSSVEKGVYKVDISMNILKTVGETTTTAKENVELAAPVMITMPIPVQFQNARFTLEHNGKAVVYTLSEDGKSISFYAPSFSPWEMKIQKCAEGKHNYVEAKDDSAWKDATHTEAGMKVEVCSICNDRKETTVPKTDHVWGEWTETVKATCTTNGSAERTCTLCDQKETKEILKTGHSMEWKVDQEATCGAEGSQHQECAVCHTKGATDVIPATGRHNMQPVVDKEATCAAEGSQHQECTVCHTKGEVTVIPATGRHNMQPVVDKEATCGTEGSQHQECIVCHTKGETTAIPATGNHSFGEYVTTKAATALEKGTETRTCSTCGKTESRDIAQVNGTIKLTVNKLPLQTGKSVELSKIVTGLAEGDYIASCTTSNKKAATVTAKGKVTGKAAGTAKITIRLASGTTAVVTINVQKKAVTTKSIKKLSKTMKLSVKEKKTLTPEINPVSTTDKLTYKSSDKKIVTVSGKGVMTAKKAGKAKVTVQSGKKKFVITVTVTAPAPTDMKKVPASKTLKKGKTFVLKPTLLPSGAAGKITYKTSDKKVAAVDAKGKVTAKGKGTAVITVSVGKVKKTCKVTVK